MSDEDYFELIPNEFTNHEYNMNPAPCQATGLCVIFNSCTFSASCLPTRKGSEKDVESIQKVFGKHFGFEVIQAKDRTKAQMEEQLGEIARDSISASWRCFVCFFLSHGLGEQYLADFEGECVDVRRLVQLFDGKNCPGMIGKPKLFFAQMCRGFDREEYERANHKYDAGHEMSVPGVVPANVSPDRDRLVCYATTEGRMAPMDPEKGSLFIQTLTKVLKQFSGEKTIEEVLKAVTFVVDREAEAEHKICPIFDSTLVGRLVFKAPPTVDKTTSMTEVNERNVTKLLDNVQNMAI